MIMRTLARHSALALALATVTGAAHAAVLEESIVTARKRIEAVQEVPVAVSVYRQQEARQSGIRNMIDLNDIVPGIEIQDGSFLNGASNIYIRGVGARYTGVNLDSGVGVYLDDVYVGRADGGLLEMNDIQRVQVLRGPQGTLFGKNTTGGAILIETNKPTPDTSLSATLRAGSEGRLDGSFALNLPVVKDTLFTRLSVQNAERDGYMENVLDGEEYSDEDRISAIWQTRWIASEDLTADLNLNYTDTDQKSRGARCVVANNSVPNQGAWLATLYNLLYVNNPVSPDDVGINVQDACAESDGLSSDEFISDLDGFYKAENQGASVTLTWAPSPSLTAKSITAWRGTEAESAEDNDSTRLPIQHNGSVHPFAEANETDQYSQEFQLSGDAFSEQLFYVAGAYYFYEETTSGRTVQVNGPWLQDDAYASSQIGLSELYTYIASGTEYGTENEAFAAYGQGEWHFNENWRLTLGLRFTQETRDVSLDYFIPDPATLTTDGVLHLDPIELFLGAITYPNDYAIKPGTGNPAHGFELQTRNGVVQSLAGDTDITEWTPLITLQYLFGGMGAIDGGSVYATFTNGFLSGGLAYNLSNGLLEEYDPETVESFEVGLKFDAFGNRFRANIAAFTMDYSDRQLTSATIGSEREPLGRFTFNADQATVNGLEIETSALPLERLELTANIAWYDPEIDSFEDTVTYLAFGGALPGCTALQGYPLQQCVVDRSDENLPLLPDTSVFLAAQYTLDMGELQLVPRLQWSKKWDMERCVDYTSCASGQFVNDEEDLSARVALRPKNGAWEITAFGTNLTDEDNVVGGNAAFDALGFGSYVYAPPRLYGAEITWNW